MSAVTRRCTDTAGQCLHTLNRASKVISLVCILSIADLLYFIFFIPCSQLCPALSTVTEDGTSVQTSSILSFYADCDEQNDGWQKREYYRSMLIAMTRTMVGRSENTSMIRNSHTQVTHILRYLHT